MSQSAKRKNLTLRIFVVLISSTFLVWLLRGFGILTFIPGGLIWLLFVLAIAALIVTFIQRRWYRF